MENKDILSITYIIIKNIIKAVSNTFQIETDSYHTSPRHKVLINRCRFMLSQHLGDLYFTFLSAIPLLIDYSILRTNCDLDRSKKSVKIEEHMYYRVWDIETC